MDNNTKQPTLEEKIFMEKITRFTKQLAELEEETGIKVVAVLDQSPFAIMARLDFMPMNIWKSYTGTDKQEKSNGFKVEKH